MSEAMREIVWDDLFKVHSAAILGVASRQLNDLKRDEEISALQLDKVKKILRKAVNDREEFRNMMADWQRDPDRLDALLKATIPKPEPE